MLTNLVVILKQKCHAQSINPKSNKLHIHIFVPLGMSMEFPKHFIGTPSSWIEKSKSN